MSPTFEEAMALSGRPFGVEAGKDAMQRAFEPSLNEFGLFLHRGAGMAIEAFVREQRVGRYPMYLVGMAMPEHRAGPALVAMLTLADGGVIDAHARSLSKKQRINGILEYDVDYLDQRGLERYSHLFNSELGGFAHACLEPSPTAAAERMLENIWMGINFGHQVGPSPQGPPAGYPSDWTDVVYYSDKAIGCVVEGFAPSADVIDQLEISSALKRAMVLPGSEELVWLDEVAERIAEEIHPQVHALVTEAWGVRVASPRASVALLRSAAELIADGLLDGSSKPFFKQLDRLSEVWGSTPLGASPAERRETAWRSTVLSCLDTVRDLGNRIHADSSVTSADLKLAHDANRRLIEAVLRVGPLDGRGSEPGAHETDPAS